MIGHIKNLVMLLFLYITLAVAQIVELNTFVLLLVALAISFIIVVVSKKFERFSLKPIADDCCFLGAAVVLCLGVFTWPNYATSM